MRFCLFATAHKTILTFLVCFSIHVYAQSPIDVFWKRVNKDSLGNEIAEKQNHFDMYSFTFASETYVRYWFLGECTLYSGIGGLCRFDKQKSLVTFSFCRKCSAFNDSFPGKSAFEKTYRFRFYETTKYIDSTLLDDEFEKQHNLTRLNFAFQLESVDDSTTIIYQGLYYKRDKAFRKMRKQTIRTLRKEHKAEKGGRRRRPV